ncbi:MAG: LppX_LprAFG lipoprotein [Spirochaetaceae bacterium]|nr:LppX_LprAFG lipoprotein [Spirochaetaceae bacterium]
MTVALLAISLLLLAAACESEPTPTPEPELTVDELLADAAEDLAALTSAGFLMIDEMESGAKFFGMTLQTVEGVVKTPASFRMFVDLVAPGLGFAEIEMVAVGEEAFMKFSADAPWVPLPLEQVPFNFGGIGVTLSELLGVVEDPVITGRESLEGAQVVRVDGDIVSDDLSALITSVDPGHPILLTLWIDEADHTLQQLRLDGQLYNDDAPETTRLIIISDVNASVDIALPDASGS